MANLRGRRRPSSSEAVSQTFFLTGGLLASYPRIRPSARTNLKSVRPVRKFRLKLGYKGLKVQWVRSLRRCENLETWRAS